MTGRAPRVGVLGLQGDVREHLRALAAVGGRPVTVRGPDELSGVDALVVPGGESTTIGKLTVLFGLLEPLRRRVATGMPVYGSCAGMILLADRLVDDVGQPRVGGLDVTVRRNAFGRQVDSFEGRVELAGITGGAVPAVFIRAPWVEQAGPQVRVLGRLGREVRSRSTGAAPGDDADRIVAVRQGCLLATAFHPELTDDTRVHRYFLDMVREQG